MNQKLFVFAAIIFISVFTFGQKQEKLFYDKDWKGCSKSKAEYYRIVSFDDNNKPIGKIKDYFLTGEIQGVADGAIAIDRNNDKNSIFTGNIINYYKNGNKKEESLFSENGTPKTLKIYYENGQLKEEMSFNDKWNMYGNYNTYFQSGKLHTSFQMNNGELVNKFFIECDEFGSCQKIFLEIFEDNKNINDWEIFTEKSYRTSIIPEKGLLMVSETEAGFKQTINIPLSLSEDFSIETTIEFKSGDINSGHGLIWGFKDWDNYYSFSISANGYYLITAVTEGIRVEFVKWTQSNFVNQNYKKNKLKILRVKDKMYFSINGNLVHTDNFYAFNGNNIGFLTLSGKKEILFENLIVKQNLETKLANNNFPNLNSEGWKGNGTGFFISTNGYLATNYHVISDASEIEIEFLRKGQKQNYKAKVIQSDKQNDLAILKVDDNSFLPFSIIPFNFQTSLIDVGSNVFTLGYPLALTVMGTEIKFTDGKISSRTGFKDDISTYQTTVPIQPGNSGGPLFDFDGNLIGINLAKINANVADNVSYAIKSNYLKNLIDVLPITLNLPSDNSIMNNSLTEKIKILSDYVVLIRIK